MLYLIVHLFAVPGMEEAFHEYEQRALSIFRSLGGETILAYRPEARAGLSTPSEIHVLRIASPEMFQQFQNDPRLVELQDMRRRVIQRTELFFSAEPVDYRPDSETPSAASPKACNSPQEENA